MLDLHAFKERVLIYLIPFPLFPTALLCLKKACNFFKNVNNYRPMIKQLFLDFLFAAFSFCVLCASIASPSIIEHFVQKLLFNN